jgi:hypothetical protein
MGRIDSIYAFESFVWKRQKPGLNQLFCNS